MSSYLRVSLYLHDKSQAHCIVGPFPNSPSLADWQVGWEEFLDERINALSCGLCEAEVSDNQPHVYDPEIWSPQRLAYRLITRIAHEVEQIGHALETRDYRTTILDLN